ncbi:VOC family protein [Pseudonocardia endophytica]|uniref:Glyoxalase-like protein n=1 Tax=Pseudonocardia endophytica TaxID=401976 RepID=A0A4V2PHY8_PSEEN|nr:VOC family protein [Pseudonocardia endophytica]TCK22566.1 glyoxalase-like protein [Pseudonocardia endophytica]
MTELDHLIVFLPGPPESAPPGLELGAGMRHDGQGTRNRRIGFAAAFVELLWIDEPDAERASGLGFAARCARQAYPFGVVLRGTRPPGAFRDYTVPGGPTLALHDGTSEMPFLGVLLMSDDELAARVPRPLPAHPNGATGIDDVVLSGAEPPPFGLPGVTVTPGPTAACVRLTGAGEVEFR